ncbi:MAG: hypothetical protein JKY98_10295 [Gammaproteobacteria bacterium]|nr:hypothetical protein [Gammaproteobacteria bacterium]
MNWKIRIKRFIAHILGRQFLFLLGGVGILTLHASTLSAQQHDQVTFTRDVAPILQRRCQECHRPGSIGPMALETFEQVSLWAPLIKDRVMKREMPPWPIDITVGIQDFKNSRSLSTAEIQTIVGWVDSGAVKGNPADMPAALEWQDHSKTWRFEKNFNRPPDLVVSSEPYTVPADGADHWPNLQTPLGMVDKRWIAAVEFRPERAEIEEVFHHANPSVGNPNVPGGMNAAIRQVRGMDGIIFADDTGVPIGPGDVVRWNMHLFPIDRVVEDAVLQLGIWLHPPESPPSKTLPGSQGLSCSQWTGHSHALGRSGDGDLPGMSADPQIGRQGDILIAPNSVATLRGVYVLDRPVRLQSLRAHMHLRGVYQILEAIYPDGRWEIINKMHNNHRWQTEFLYKEDAMPLFPKGTFLISTCVYDNTDANPLNPDPTVWVTRGERTVDEMGHFRAQMLFYESEEEFQVAVRERERRLQLAPNKE